MSAVTNQSFSRLAGWALAALLVFTMGLVATPPARADDALDSPSQTLTEEGPVLESAVPSISGLMRFGETLTVDPGSWTEGTEFTYQWFADEVAIEDASSDSLALSTAEIGKLITVVVTGSKEGYRSVSMTSLAATSVTALPLTAARPGISGAIVVGSTVTAKPGVWTPRTEFSFQWYANGAAISGATEATYVITAAQVGQRLTVEVTGALADHVTASRASAQTAAVKVGTLVAPVPTISGSVAVGSTVTAKLGVWTAGTAFAYQWYADGKAISKATKSTLKVASAQQGKKLSVKVTGKKAGYTTASTSSKQTAKAPKVATPSISGKAATGSKLTAKAGSWTSGAKLSYQWLADGKAISKATKSTYTPSSAVTGKALTVRITGKKSGYATIAMTSKATPRVPKAATPTISGAKTVLATLNASTGTWTSGTSFTYQWYANGKAISGATKSSLKLGSAHGGKKISVKVTGKRSGHTTVSKTSKATAAIGYPSRTGPVSLSSCPSWAPIKGNASSGIYHMRGQRFYDRTYPEDCFRTEKAARDAGYRKAKV